MSSFEGVGGGIVPEQNVDATGFLKLHTKKSRTSVNISLHENTVGLLFGNQHCVLQETPQFLSTRCD